MNKTSLALILSIIAGLLCLAKFIFSYYKHSQLDYTILFAGVFIIAFGISTNSKRK